MRIGYARVSTRDQNADDQTPHSGGGRLKSRQSRGPAARQAAQAQPAQLVALHQAGERTISELEELFSATRSPVYRATPAAGPAPLPDPDSEGRDTGAGVPTFPGISFGRSGPTPSAHSTAADCSSSATGSSAQTRAPPVRAPAPTPAPARRRSCPRAAASRPCASLPSKISVTPKGRLSRFSREAESTSSASARDMALSRSQRARLYRAVVFWRQAAPQQT